MGTRRLSSRSSSAWPRAADAVPSSAVRSANERGLPSYPSRSPRKELDFVLYGDGIRVTGFSVPAVRFSDHLPLVCDFEVERGARAAA